MCDACSRTLLKGEELHEYVSPQGERFGVCVLCRSRAESSGWIPAEQYGTIAREPPTRRRRGRALRRRLGQVATRARRGASKGVAEPAEPPAPEPPVEEGPSAPGGAAEPDPPPAAATASEPAKARRAKPASAPGRQRARRPRQQAKRRSKPRSEPGTQPAQPRPRRGPEAIMKTAVERFNSSDERRKVAGLIRSLGEPQAAVRPDPSRQLALVTVAWELSWYQWEVSANGDDGPVREVAKGKEVSELAAEARAWNAAVAEDGELRLRGARARTPSEATQA